MGVLAGWEPDDGSYDWECRDAILKWTFYTSVPISILRPIRKLDTTDQIFKYLAKCFRNSEPIPHANEFQCAGTAAAAEMPEKSPMSADAATERHAMSRTKHIWYSEHGTYYRFEFILERVMSVTHVAVILCTRTSPAYEEEFMKMDYPDVRNEYGTL